MRTRTREGCNKVDGSQQVYGERNPVLWRLYEECQVLEDLGHSAGSLVVLVLFEGAQSSRAPLYEWVGDAPDEGDKQKPSYAIHPGKQKQYSFSVVARMEATAMLPFLTGAILDKPTFGNANR